MVLEVILSSNVVRRLTTDDYAVDAVTGAKALVGAWLCRRLDDGTVVRRRITETEAYCGEIWYNERNPLKGGGR